MSATPNDRSRSRVTVSAPVEEGRTPRKRRAILEAATEVFLQHGYLGASMDAVAARAAVSKQTVYKQFTDGFANADGTPNPNTSTTAVQVRLSEHDGGTRMELRFVFESKEHMEQLERWGAFDVFPQSVGQMDALLNSPDHLAQEAL